MAGKKQRRSKKQKESATKLADPPGDEESQPLVPNQPDIVEKPSLDLSVEVPKEGLPKEVPDVFGDDPVEQVLKHEQDIEMESLLKDVDVLLIIGDHEGAKESYKAMMSVFNRLPLQRKKKYFDQVNKVYREISHFNRFHYRLRRFFLSKKHQSE